MSRDLRIRVDPDEKRILDRFREIREHGHGRVEITVVSHEMDTLYAGKSYKREKKKASS